MSEPDLPEGWAWTTLNDLGEWYGGGTPSKKEPAYWNDGHIPWLSPKDMGQDVLTGTQDCITNAAVLGSAVKVVPEGSVAVVVRSGILERTVPVALVPFATTLNQDMKAITPHAGVDARWLTHALRARESVVLGTCRRDGTTVASLATDAFQKLPIALPPSVEQARIADEVERRLSHLDASERALERALHRLSLARAAIENEMLWVQDVPSLPLREVLQARGLANGKSVPDREGGFPVLRLTCMKGGTVDLRERKAGAWTREEAARFLVREGDFFVIRGNGSISLVGRGARVIDEPDEVAYPDTLIRVRVDQSKMRTDFLALVWNSRKVRQQIEAVAHTTAGIYKVNQKQLSGIQLPCPELDVQEALAQEVSRRLSHLDAADRAIQSQVRRCAAVRASILSAAFTGKLVRQDPADEPATALLARIKEQRAGAIQSRKTTRKPRAKKETTP